MKTARKEADLRAQLRAVLMTPCGACSHPFHLHHPRCEFPAWPKPDTKRCMCKKFIDPETGAK